MGVRSLRVRMKETLLRSFKSVFNISMRVLLLHSTGLAHTRSPCTPCLRRSIFFLPVCCSLEVALSFFAIDLAPFVFYFHPL